MEKKGNETTIRPGGRGGLKNEISNMEPLWVAGLKLRRPNNMCCGNKGFWIFAKFWDFRILEQKAVKNQLFFKGNLPWDFPLEKTTHTSENGIVKKPSA